uniref:Uncharacterized protein n=1 Tax=Rhizophora mucronata TaxID=61149 RepID=A0A2P2MAT0_RHIMU
MIIFDEIDSIAQRRESVHSENGSDRVVSQLLTMVILFFLILLFPSFSIYCSPNK